MFPTFPGSFVQRTGEERRGSMPGVGWKGLREFVIDRIESECDDIKSFYLKPIDGRPLPPHRPGQFLTIRREIPGQEPVTRTYTVSTRSNPDYYRLSIKREPGRHGHPPGLVSNIFHTQVAVGERLHAREPSGKFWLDTGNTGPVVLLSGGVGVTPMIAMLEAWAADRVAHPIWFIHGVRNGRAHAFRRHVKSMAAEFPCINTHFCYSQPTPDDHLGPDYDTRGHITIELLNELLNGDLSFDFYLCGPSAFMESMYTGLRKSGVAEDKIGYEHFGPATVLGADRGGEAGRDDSPPIGHQVTFAKSDVTVPWDSKVAGNLLELAEYHGLQPEFGCRSGVCHSCMSPLKEGDVEYQEDLADGSEVEEGMVLLCCTKPKTNVVIDV
jgi:ferredoxin-NADP reductase